MSERHLRDRVLVAALALAGLGLLGFSGWSLLATLDRDEPCYAGSLGRGYVNDCPPDAPAPLWVTLSTLALLAFISLLLWLLRRRRAEMSGR